jgi:hypothetical protein
MIPRRAHKLPHPKEKTVQDIQHAILICTPAPAPLHLQILHRIPELAKIHLCWWDLDNTQHLGVLPARTRRLQVLCDGNTRRTLCVHECAVLAQEKPNQLVLIELAARGAPLLCVGPPHPLLPHFLEWKPLERGTTGHGSGDGTVPVAEWKLHFWFFDLNLGALLGHVPD